MCAEGFQGAGISTQPHPVALPELISPVGVENDPIEKGSTGLLHPKYQRPAQCFATVTDAVNPKTWKLHLFYPNGAIDMARLPKAIQTIVTDYPGLKVT